VYVMSDMYVILKPNTCDAVKDVICSVSYKLSLKRKVFFIKYDILDTFSCLLALKYSRL
jgi:hypothetical protein